MATEFRLYLYQFDISSAFLESKLNRDDIYVIPDKSYFELTKQGRDTPLHLRSTVVLQLTRSLYGLKEAPALFNKTLPRQLKKLGFHQNHYDQCTFYRYTDGRLAIICLHVDDGLVMTHTKQEAKEIIVYYTKDSRSSKRNT